MQGPQLKLVRTKIKNFNPNKKITLLKLSLMVLQDKSASKKQRKVMKKKKEIK
jgi:hypothetical protein